MTSSDQEIHICLLWEYARKREKRIIAQLRSKFEIIALTEVRWSKKYFPRNLTRFYGVNLPPNSFKEIHCGLGPFLVIVVKDSKPKYGMRLTSKGYAWVNTTMFDAKVLFRKWTGGGHRVHCTNTQDEANHDLVLLFGKNAVDFCKGLKPKRDTKIEKISRELEGFAGWESLTHFFYILNATCRYVVLRNFEYLPDSYKSAEHGDIDLLVEDYQNSIYIANARPVFTSEDRVHHTLRIANEDVYFDFRFVGDLYYDTNWEKDILCNRQLQSKGFFAPQASHYYYSLLYHALWHKPVFSLEYKRKLLAIKRNRQTLETLTTYLIKNQYEYTVPRDQSVFIHKSLLTGRQDDNQRHPGDSKIFTNLRISQRSDDSNEILQELVLLREKLNIITSSKLHRLLWKPYCELKKIAHFLKKA